MKNITTLSYSALLFLTLTNVSLANYSNTDHNSEEVMLNEAEHPHSHPHTDQHSHPHHSHDNKKQRHQRPKFSSLDTNQDGNIDFNEFSAHKLPKGTHDEVFPLIDSNQDKVISQDEFLNHKPPCKGERGRKRQGKMQ